MNTPSSMQSADGSVPRYISAKDVCDLFTEEMHSLYLLAFLLLADQSRAEACLISTLGDSAEPLESFLVWARTSARFAIIQEAIRMSRVAPFRMSYVSGLLIRHTSEDRNKPFAAIASLGKFERFVFVISVLEGQSDEACADLLGCTRRDVVMGREFAQLLLAASDVEFDTPQQSEYSLATISAVHPCCGTC